MRFFASIAFTLATIVSIVLGQVSPAFAFAKLVHGRGAASSLGTTRDGGDVIPRGSAPDPAIATRDARTSDLHVLRRTKSPDRSSGPLGSDLALPAFARADARTFDAAPSVLAYRGWISWVSPGRARALLMVFSN